jgi:ketosteroid isomerase-like protein
VIGYAEGGAWLEAYGHAWESFDGDAWVALFTDDAEYHEDPYGTPLVGHNALRAYMLDAAASQRDVEFTIEQHWVSGATVLAAWHVSFTRRSTGRPVRMAGFLVADVAPEGRVSRFREWTTDAPGAAG